MRADVPDRFIDELLPGARSLLKDTEDGWKKAVWCSRGKGGLWGTGGGHAS
jgi:hypothetical protein